MNDKDVKLGETKNPFIMIMLPLAIATSAWISLRLTFSHFGIDSDSSHTAILWNEINHKGLILIKDWLFTPDSWILSLVPIHFAAFTLFVPRPEVLIGIG